MSVQNVLRRFLVGALVAWATSAAIAAQPQPPLSNGASTAITSEGASGYDLPPKFILDVMHAPSPPVPQVSPTEDAILLVFWQDYPPVARVATPFLRLAGVRVEPKNHSKHDTTGRLPHHPVRYGF